ncbi:glycosyltransferase family 4 protein [Gelatiniphilus marinus]|uniref:Glycosyltransferase family 4 protein n=1 Tax=Gelatiniphilus marinus TaxID=1759464 RepID=A0ABW5JTR6_9FLAO
MKIAFLTPEYPHRRTGTAGGIGTSILNLTKGLIALGHQVVILVYGQDKDAYFEEDNVQYYKIKNIKIKGLSFYFTQKKVERLIDKLYSENKIDIVEAPDWTGFTAFINPKCPLVIRENGSDTYFCHLDNRPVKFKNKYLEKRALKKADAIISVSHFTGTLTNKLFKLKSPFTVIPNAIDVLAFKPFPKTDTRLTILYFGTLIRKKGLLELPEIFNKVHAENKEAELVLVGKDSPDIFTNSKSTWALMQPLFNANAIKKVNYLGAVPYKDMQDLIQQATVCVFPTFAEALPVSWIEAMAMEKPIVASNVGWAKEVISDGINGYLVHPKDHTTYANRILELLEKPSLQKEFGKAARKKATTTFSAEVVAKQSVEFYKTMVTL